MTDRCEHTLQLLLYTSEDQSEASRRRYRLVKVNQSFSIVTIVNKHVVPGQMCTTVLTALKKGTK